MTLNFVGVFTFDETLWLITCSQTHIKKKENSINFTQSPHADTGYTGYTGYNSEKEHLYLYLC